jgi:hypothetical protein
VVGWFTRTLVGLALMVAGAAVLAFSIWKLLRIGSCGRDGPTGVSRPCPKGTELYMLAILPAVTSAALGGWILAGRGRLRSIKPGLPT